MYKLSAKSIATVSVVLAGLAFTQPSRATAVVFSGWDLLVTQPGTTFGGAPFQGVPLGTFNFGSGLQGVGNADTIVHRLAPAVGPVGVIPIELAALHLMSVIPVNFGLGLGSYFITLQSERGGPASAGQMTINFGPEGIPHGTFNSFFDVFFDIRLGSLTGPIALSDSLRLSSSGTPWSHDAAPGAILINGVNRNLNGSNSGNDFHPIGSIDESHPTGARHVARDASSVPDAGPSVGLLLVSLGFFSLGRFLPCGRGARLRCGSAAQSGQERHRRVNLPGVNR